MDIDPPDMVGLWRDVAEGWKSVAQTFAASVLASGDGRDQAAIDLCVAALNAYDEMMLIHKDTKRVSND